MRRAEKIHENQMQENRRRQCVNILPLVPCLNKVCACRFSNSGVSVLKRNQIHGLSIVHREADKSFEKSICLLNECICNEFLAYHLYHSP